jgi:enamine deaminase RidA (YjgF/YER057c/UK114 family)
VPAVDGKDIITGRLTNEGGGGLTVDEGYEAAKWCALNLISTIKDELDGDLDRVAKVIKVFGIVAGSDDFHAQPLVMNGASDTFGVVFGKEVGGYHARSAIGTNALPLGMAVEVEAIVRVK